MVASFVRKYRATHQRGPQNKSKQSDPKPGVAADFRLLLRATILVLGKSTFGFWAGYLSSKARSVHMPVESRRHPFERIPLVASDPRFVYHNPGADQWFGKAQGPEGSIRYEERGRWFGPKSLDELGNYIPRAKRAG